LGGPKPSRGPIKVKVEVLNPTEAKALMDRTRRN